MTAKIERFTCQKCGKRWWALDTPQRLPCTCDPAFMPKYIDVLEAHGERTEVFYFGPPVDRLQDFPTLIDSSGKLYRVNARIFASRAVYEKMQGEIAALKAAARDVVAQYDDEVGSMGTPRGPVQTLRDLVHPPLGAHPTGMVYDAAVREALVTLGRALRKEGSIGQGIPHAPSNALGVVLRLAREAAEVEDVR